MTEPTAMRKAMLHDCITELVVAARRQIQHDCGDGTVELAWDERAVKRAVENLSRHILAIAGVA